MLFVILKTIKFSSKKPYLINGTYSLRLITLLGNMGAGADKK